MLLFATLLASASIIYAQITFTDINAGLTGVRYCALSWGDYDNDGDLDLAISGNWISKIYRSDNGTFVDINAGLTGVKNCALSWGDYDNDGDLDLAIAGYSSNYDLISKIYRNDNGNFVDINAGLIGVSFCALSWGDYDNDGDLDLAIAGSSYVGTISKIYRNDGCFNNWIDIQTRGIQSNADGVGAWVKCGLSSQWREVSDGEGWVNRIAHFGIGNQNEIDEITVHWPQSGITDTLLQIQANQQIIIYEGDQIIVNITPNGDEILPGASGQGHTYEIMWNVENPPTNIDYVTIHYSTDSGNSFPYLIADNEPDDGIYLWSVPDVSTSTARIRIQFKDVNGSVLFDGMSDADFSIDTIPPSGTITLVSPANGDWTSGTPYFDWSTSGLVDVTNFGIIVDGEYLITGLPTYPTYYQTPDDLSLSSGWHTWTVRGLDVAGNWVQSPQTWSLRVDAAPPSQFSLISPEDNLWTSNNSPTFQWTPSMDNGTGLAEYQLYMNDNLVVDNIPPTVTQWSAITGSLEDDFESGLSNWNTQGNWGLTSSSSHSGNYSATDSPDGNYSNNQNVAITLAQPVTIQGANNLTLSYWYRCNFYYYGYDHLYVEISSNGSSWTQIADYNSNQSVWTQAVHNLDAYSNWSQVYVRFRLYTNSYGNADGFYFDDFSLIGSGMELSDGDYDWYVVAVDNVGNSQQSNETYLLHIDTTPPHGETGTFTCISPSNNIWTPDTLITFSWSSCIDAGIGLEYYELFIDGTSISGEIIDTNYVLTPQQILENGTHNWYVIAVDSLNNSTSTSQFTLNIDRIPPAEFSLISPADSSFFIMPTPTFEWNATTDAGCGLSHYELWIDDNISVDNLTQTQTAPGSPLSEGYHIWYVIAEDNVGNRIQSTESWTAIGDWNPPTQPILVSPINNEIVSLSQPEMVWLKSTDAGSGVSYYNLYVDNELVYPNFVPDDINADTVSVQCPVPLENGNHTWYVEAFDYAGGQNSSIYGYFEVDVDITPPTSEISDPVPDQYIGGESYLVIGSAEDNVGGVGVEKVEISFDGGNTWFETTETGKSNDNRLRTKSILSAKTFKNVESVKKVSHKRDVYNWEFLWIGYETGSITIMTRATDFNGNVESPPNAVQVNIEIIPPQISNLNVSPNPTSYGTVNFTITFQTGTHCGGMNNSITPTVTYTPSGGISTPITQTNYQGNIWQGQTTIAQTELNGTAVITVFGATDNINNVMLPDSSYNFVIDTQPPYAFDLITPLDSTWINNSQPLLTWGIANDSTTSINNYSLEIDGSTSSPGINYIPPTQTSITPSEPLTLGIHTWRIKAVDQAGNSRWSNSTFTIGLDLSSPVSEISSPINGSTIGGLSYTITGTSTDGVGVGVSEVDYVEIRFYHNGSWTGWLPVVNTGTNYNTWSYEWSGYESGSYTIESKATDNAGNVEISPLQTTVYVDLDPPVVDNVTVTPNPTSIGQITCTVIFDVNDLGLNFSIHPDVWFTTLNGDSISFVEISYSEITWTGVANITAQTENGTATVHVKGATDNLNNVMTPNHNAGDFVIDTQAPTVSTINVTPEITNVRNDLQVEIVFEEEISGLNPNVFPSVNIIPANSDTNEYIPVSQTGYNIETNTWTGIAEITEQTNEGQADVNVSLAEDQAGNVMTEIIIENQLVIDHSPPEEFELIYPTDSLWTSNRQPEFIWSSSSDTISGLSYYQLFINDNQVGENISPDDTSKVIETPLTDAGYRARISALDNADEPNIRWSGSDSVHFNVDGTPPNTDITFPSSGYIVQGNSITVQGVANDGIGVYAGIGVYIVLLSSDGGASWDTVFVASEQFLGEIEWEHTYLLTPGPHTLVAKSIDWLGNEEIEGSSVSITVESISPTANFSADTTSGYAPLTVNFTDLSIPGSWPIVAWEWDFGDSTFSNEQNPTHEYISVGNYTVSLTVFDEYNTTDIMTVENLITIINRAPYVISEIPDQIVEEDFEAFTINLDDHFADDDGDDLIYLVEYNSDEIQAAVDDSILTLSSVQDWFGTASIVVTANDGHSDKRKYSKSKNRYRASCSDTFDVVIQPVNDAPILNYFIPEDTTFTIKVDSTVMFTISAYDVDSEIQFSWFIDDENQEISDSIFTYIFIEEGEYEVKSVVSDEEYSVETVWHVTVEAVSVDNNVVVIYQTKLYQNTPNPFNPETKICFDIKDNNSDVSLAIYDIKGQLVKRLVKRNYNRGKYSVIWNGKDNNEKDVPSGIYFFKMEMDKFSNVKKCILLK